MPPGDHKYCFVCSKRVDHLKINGVTVVTLKYIQQESKRHEFLRFFNITIDSVMSLNDETVCKSHITKMNRTFRSGYFYEIPDNQENPLILSNANSEFQNNNEANANNLNDENNKNLNAENNNNLNADNHNNLNEENNSILNEINSNVIHHHHHHHLHHHRYYNSETNSSLLENSSNNSKKTINNEDEDDYESIIDHAC